MLFPIRVKKNPPDRARMCQEGELNRKQKVKDRALYALWLSMHDLEDH
jgi:hypothetical protein